MQKLFKDDSLTLHTDLYQINMMQTYWELGRADLNAVFECYFRDMPFENGYAIFAGLERLIDYLNDLSFSETDIAYLREIGGYPEVLFRVSKGVQVCLYRSFCVRRRFSLQQ